MIKLFLAETGPHLFLEPLVTC